MYDYQNGDIFIDGISLKDVNKKHIRSHVGVVLQDPFLYSKTVFENIAIAHKNADKNRVYFAAATAALEKDIKTFKQGYETIVGEKGTTLSGGQKQRVSIARALAKNPSMLILDDCLSAVDTHTEHKILNNLKKIMVGKTSLIISHRVSSAKLANRIMVLQDGQIVETGNHAQLMKRKGYYYELYQNQLNEEENGL